MREWAFTFAQLAGRLTGSLLLGLQMAYLPCR